MDAKITIEFLALRVCDEEDLEEDYTFSDLVKEVIELEGLFGIAEDEFTIIKIEEND